MKKKIFIILLISIICVGCREKSIIVKDASDNVKVEDMDYYLSLNMEIEKYATVMSSVPGLPLIVTTELHNKELDIELRFECEEGEFLLWNNGKVERIGKEYISNFINFSLYWTPLTKEGSEVEDSSIVITVSNKETGDKQLSKRKYSIIKEDGFYYYNDKEYEILD